MLFDACGVGAGGAIRQLVAQAGYDGRGAKLYPYSLAIRANLEAGIEMDREALEGMLYQMPLRITMKDGRSFVVETEQGIALSDLDAYVLYRSSDGKLRGIHLPYVTMTGVEVNVCGISGWIPREPFSSMSARSGQPTSKAFSCRPGVANLRLKSIPI